MKPRCGWLGCLVFVALLVVVALGVPTSATAQLQPISGNLSQPGYTVIALAQNGEANTALARPGAFSLVPPAETVTLHLRGPDGTYAGPVVLEDAGGEVKRARVAVKRAKRKLRRAKRIAERALRRLREASGEQASSKARKRLRKARRKLKRARRPLRRARRLLRQAQRLEAERPNRAILGVRAGAPLGEVIVNSAAGYALARGLRGREAQAWVDTARAAQAQGGVPIGAGNFGRVPSARLDGRAIGDLDRDAVPDPLDIDDDGDLVLDGLDSLSGALAAQSPGGTEILDVGTGLALPLHDLVNADLVDSSGERIFKDAQIEAALPTFGVIGVEILPGDSAELDCGGSPNPAPPPAWVGGLSYCTLGGTGRDVINFNPPEGTPFPGCCDADGDGFGSFKETMGRGLLHGATTAQIASGNLLTEWVMSGGTAAPCPPPDGTLSDFCTPHVGTVQFVFATVPAIVSYSDSDVPPHAGTVSYPVSGPADPEGPGPGNTGNGFPVSAPPGGDLVLGLTYVRPQRRPTSETECRQPPQPLCTQQEWIDIGGLIFQAGVGELAAMGRSCPQESFESTDPELIPDPRVGSADGGLADTTGDLPASPGNTLSFKLNVTKCLQAQGASLSPDEEFAVSFMARPRSLGGLAVTGVAFKFVE